MSRYFCSSFVVAFLFLCYRPLPAMGADNLMILDSPIRISFNGFASSMATVDDVDGDGVTDYIVGAYDSQVRYPSPVELSEHEGRAFVFSGKTGDLLFTLSTPEPMPYAAFGFAVASAGDVNQDGTPDFFVGAFGYGGRGPLGHGGSGRAFVFSGKDGQLIRTLQAPEPQTGGGFGWAVSSLSDSNGDNVPELLVGAFGQDGTGRVFVFEGKNGELLRTLEPPPPPGVSSFGWSIADAGDLNKDSIADILVGAPYSTVNGTTAQGRAYAFSGKDGQLLLTLSDPQPVSGEVFGWRIISTGDLNKDGTPDILVSAPYKDIGSNPQQGIAMVFNGANGEVLYTLNNPAPKPYAAFGHVLAKGPDVDEDSAAEILVGAPFQTVDQFQVQGEVFVFNGWDGRHLITFDDPFPHQGASFGYSIASPGDVNGDKFPDFAIGASGQSIMDKVAVGRVFVFLSRQ